MSKVYPLVLFIVELMVSIMRKELYLAKQKNNTTRIKELSIYARELAIKLANESKDLFERDEILGKYIT